MPLSDIEHFLILAEDMQATRDFYVYMLGLTEGNRPDFGFPGHWLYLGDEPCVHIASAQLNADKAASRYLSRSQAEARQPGTGAVDHVAFRGTGLVEMRARLRAGGILFHERQADAEGRYQLFFNDPNGVKVELNYPAAEAAALSDKPSSLLG